MKVLFVVIDTLRADHLGRYGYHRNTSPRLDDLAKEGVLFERAYATDVPTQPSYTAMFTGQRGIRSGVVSHSPTEDIPDSTPYLPHILAMAGYETAAVSTLFFMKKYFARGFHTYMNPVAHDRQRIQQVTAEEINSYALPWLKANCRRTSSYLCITGIHTDCTKHPRRNIGPCSTKVTSRIQVTIVWML